MAHRGLTAVVGLIGLALVAFFAVQSGLWVDVVGVGEYEEGTVTVREGTATPTGSGVTATPTGSDVTATPTGSDWGDETAVATRDSAVLATVEVRIADTWQQRYTGLSETDSMGPDEGMLFVHDEAEQHTYVMRNMSFPLDIIFIAENGTITTIRHAPTPPEGESYSETYPGRGRYVLEVNRGWTNRTGVSVGDTVELPESVA